LPILKPRFYNKLYQSSSWFETAVCQKKLKLKLNITNYIKAHLGLKHYLESYKPYILLNNKLYQSSSWFETLSIPLTKSATFLITNYIKAHLGLKL